MRRAENTPEYLIKYVCDRSEMICSRRAAATDSAHLHMSKEQTKDLLKFLKPFPDNVQQMALWLREFIWTLYLDSSELIYDNYNALAFGWSPTEFPKAYIKKPMKEAYANSLAKVKDKKLLMQRATITKSISAKKRPAGRGTAKKSE
jgi:hypothetical protein